MKCIVCGNASDLGKFCSEQCVPSWYGKAAKSSALNVQPQGDHYRKMKIQPVEYISANNIPFMAGNIIKYASRYRDKNGAKDIEKIKHYCDLILELEYGKE
jgi:hypothetical protein